MLNPVLTENALDFYRKVRKFATLEEIVNEVIPRTEELSPIEKMSLAKYINDERDRIHAEYGCGPCGNTGRIVTSNGTYTCGYCNGTGKR